MKNVYMASISATLLAAGLVAGCSTSPGDTAASKNTESESPLAISGIPRKYYNEEVIEQYPMAYGEYNPDVVKGRCNQMMRKGNCQLTSSGFVGSGCCAEGVQSSCYNDYNDCLRDHWWNDGRFGGRRATTTFDPSFYRAAYPDLQAAYDRNGKPDWGAYVDHYVNSGRNNEVRTGSLCDAPLFYAGEYLPQVGSQVGVGDKELCDHWETYGLNEGRVASKFFSVNAYKARYADVRGMSNRDAAIHFVAFGKAEGRNGAP